MTAHAAICRLGRDDLVRAHHLIAEPMVAIGMRVYQLPDRRRFQDWCESVQHRGSAGQVPKRVDEQRRAFPRDQRGIAFTPTAVGSKPRRHVLPDRLQAFGEAERLSRYTMIQGVQGSSVEDFAETERAGVISAAVAGGTTRISSFDRRSTTAPRAACCRSAPYDRAARNR